MKNISLSLLVLCLYTGVSAQYKKASFFEKTGRTYGLGTRLFALGDGKGSPIGYTLSFGTDQDGKQWFYNCDITYLPSYSFSFNTTNYNDAPVTVSGTTKPNLILGYFWGYHLLKNENNEQLFKPYATLGFQMSTLGGPKEEDLVNDSWDNKKVVGERNFSGGLGGGVGTMLNFTSWLGLRLEGGYMYQFNFKKDGANTYHLLNKHPYVTAGLRFRVVSE
ncbi:MAG: hypothetical protein J7621_12355 [Niastella sp.]|nr:hypothetical protein [Niastella sp.]